MAPVLLATLLMGCGGPVFVPEAGPGAPGYKEISAPRPAEVELVRTGRDMPRQDAGVIDSVVYEDGVLSITGWAVLGSGAQRGVLEVVLPAEALATARVQEVSVAPRPDVVAATADNGLLWSGFSLRVSGIPGAETAICVVSRSDKGSYRLGGSDPALCPA